MLWTLSICKSRWGHQDTWGCIDNAKSMQSQCICDLPMASNPRIGITFFRTIIMMTRMNPIMMTRMNSGMVLGWSLWKAVRTSEGAKLMHLWSPNGFKSKNSFTDASHTDASYTNDDDRHDDDDRIVHKWWWLHRTQMMMIASYTNDDEHHRDDDRIVHKWWWSSYTDGTFRWHSSRSRTSVF